MSSDTQQLQDPSAERGCDSPVSNPASANTATNSESAGHSTDLQVCVSVYSSLKAKILKAQHYGCVFLLLMCIFITHIVFIRHSIMCFLTLFF